MGKPIDWSPWEERTIEGFGPVVRVEIPAPLAYEVRELALKLHQAPEAVLGCALAFGLIAVREKEALPEVPS